MPVKPWIYPCFGFRGAIAGVKIVIFVNVILGAEMAIWVDDFD